MQSLKLRRRQPALSISAFTDTRPSISPRDNAVTSPPIGTQLQRDRTACPLHHDRAIQGARTSATSRGKSHTSTATGRFRQLLHLKPHSHLAWRLSCTLCRRCQSSSECDQRAESCCCPRGGGETEGAKWASSCSRWQGKEEGRAEQGVLPQSG